MVWLGLTIFLSVVAAEQVNAELRRFRQKRDVARIIREEKNLDRALESETALGAIGIPNFLRKSVAR